MPTNPYAASRNITNSPTEGNQLLHDRLLGIEGGGAAQTSSISARTMASANGLGIAAAQAQFSSLIGANGDFSLNIRGDLNDAMFVASEPIAPGMAPAQELHEGANLGPKLKFMQNSNGTTRLYITNDGPNNALCRFRIVGADTTVQLEAAEVGDGASISLQPEVVAGSVWSLASGSGIFDALAEPIGDKVPAVAAITALVLAEGATTSGNTNAGAVQDHRMILAPGAEVDIRMVIAAGTFTVTPDTIWITELKVQLATGPLC